MSELPMACVEPLVDITGVEVIGEYHRAHASALRQYTHRGVAMTDRSGQVIERSVGERAELLRRVACYTLPHEVVVQARMILYAAGGQ